VRARSARRSRNLGSECVPQTPGLGQQQRSCEHAFALTSQGHPYARFRRALASGNPTLAFAAAAELPYVAIEDALALTLLLVAREPPRYGRVALRWHARYCRELPGVELDEAVAVLALLSVLQGQAAGSAASALAELLSGQNEPRLAEVVRRWQVERQPSH
jgi:hypothetical protein